MDLATEIKIARQTLGLTQEQAAFAWDVPLPTLRQWEQRVHRPRGLALKMLRSIIDPVLADKPASASSASPAPQDAPAAPKRPRRPKSPPKAKRRQRRA